MALVPVRSLPGAGLLPGLPGLPGPDQVVSAASNMAHKVLYGGLADLRPMPRTLIDDGLLREVYHYRPSGTTQETGDPVLLVTPLAAGVATFFLHPAFGRVERSINVFDAFGLGLFSVAGALTASEHGLGPLPATLLGVITGIGGGVLRDVLTGQVPSVLRKGELYAQEQLPIGHSQAVACFPSGCINALNAQYGSSHNGKKAVKKQSEHSWHPADSVSAKQGHEQTKQRQAWNGLHQIAQPKHGPL